MNLDVMLEIQRRGGRFWNVSLLAELFEAPLPAVDAAGNSIEDWSGLFRSSEIGELFIPTTDKVSFAFTGEEEEHKVSSLEFVAWQLHHASPEMIYHLINKVDGQSIAKEIYSDADEEMPKSWRGIEFAEYWLSDAEETWLNEYEKDSYTIALDFIRMCQDEKPLALALCLAECILDENFGLTCPEYFEADLSEDFSTRNVYAVWDVKIMCVAKGRMFPYVEAGGSHLIMDDCKVFYYGVRNYDEG
jgi:hypothetical protein